MTVSAIVLAAGAARRFGAQKLLARVNGHAVVRLAADRAAASAVDETIVVTGADDAEVRGALRDARVRCVINRDWERGMGGSIAAGIAALSPGTQAALIVLGDQPDVPADAYAAVLAAPRGPGTAIIVPVYRGKRGHPVLFTDACFAELAALDADRGARGVLERDSSRVREVALDLALPHDVDVATDVANFAINPEITK